MNDSIKALLSVTDRVLLDIKYTTDEKYLRYAGCHLAPVLSFLDYLEEKKIKTTLRQVIIPTLNDDEDNIIRLREIAASRVTVDKVELLPFKKICRVKYDSLGIPFPLGHLPTPTKETIKRLNKIINDK